MGDRTQNFFSAIFDDATALESERKKMAVRIMPIDYDRSVHSDLGYSGWVQFPDGEIYIVNYINDDAPKGQIRGYSLRPGDIVFGEKKKPEHAGIKRYLQWRTQTVCAEFLPRF